MLLLSPALAPLLPMIPSPPLSHTLSTTHPPTTRQNMSFNSSSLCARSLYSRSLLKQNGFFSSFRGIEHQYMPVKLFSVPYGVQLVQSITTVCRFLGVPGALYCGWWHVKGHSSIASAKEACLQHTPITLRSGMAAVQYFRDISFRCVLIYCLVWELTCSRILRSLYCTCEHFVKIVSPLAQTPRSQIRLKNVIQARDA